MSDARRKWPGHVDTLYISILQMFIFYLIYFYHLFVLENIISITKTMVDIARPKRLIIKAGKKYSVIFAKFLFKYLGPLVLK